MLQRQSRIPVKKRHMLLKCFAQDKTAMMTAEDCDVSRVAANRYFRHYRECILQAARHAPRFNGEVEIDQAFFGGRSRKSIEYEKRILVKRRKPSKKIQVIGFLQREGDVYVKVIQKADRETIFPIVHMVCVRGTIIYTDKWRAYTKLEISGYEHRQTNHSIGFFDRRGIHINSIESFWSFAKRRLAKFNGLSRTTLLLHIKECEARYNYKEFLRFMKSIVSY